MKKCPDSFHSLVQADVNAQVSTTMESSESDEEDSHCCGRCKQVFYDIDEYLMHKKAKTCKKSKSASSDKERTDVSAKENNQIEPEDEVKGGGDRDEKPVIQASIVRESPRKHRQLEERNVVPDPHCVNNLKTEVCLNRGKQRLTSGIRGKVPPKSMTTCSETKSRRQLSKSKSQQETGFIKVKKETQQENKRIKRHDAKAPGVRTRNWQKQMLKIKVGGFKSTCVQYSKRSKVENQDGKKRGPRGVPEEKRKRGRPIIVGPKRKDVPPPKKKQIRSCPKCSFTTEEADEYERHLRREHSVTSHTCQTCGNSFVDKYKLKRHRLLGRCHMTKRHRNPAQIEQPDLNAAAPSAGAELSDTTNAVSINTTIDCLPLEQGPEMSDQGCVGMTRRARRKSSVADVSNKDRIIGASEKKQGNAQKDILSKTLMCLECRQEFNGYESLLQHMETHPDIFPGICPFCTRWFPTKYKLNRHLMCSIHDQIPDEEIQKVKSLIQNVKIKGSPTPDFMEKARNAMNYRCELCNQAFLGQHQFRKHLMSHPVRAKLKRCLCGASFVKQQDYLLHLKYQHGIQGEKKGTNWPLVCLVCRKAFQQKNHIFRHRFSLHTARCIVPASELTALLNSLAEKQNTTVEKMTLQNSDTDIQRSECFVCKYVTTFENFAKHIEHHRMWVLKSEEGTQNGGLQHEPIKNGGTVQQHQPITKDILVLTEDRENNNTLGSMYPESDEVSSTGERTSQISDLPTDSQLTYVEGEPEELSGSTYSSSLDHSYNLTTIDQKTLRGLSETQAMMSIMQMGQQIQAKEQSVQSQGDGNGLGAYQDLEGEDSEDEAMESPEDLHKDSPEDFQDDSSEDLEESTQDLLGSFEHLQDEACDNGQGSCTHPLSHDSVKTVHTLNGHSPISQDYADKNGVDGAQVSREHHEIDLANDQLRDESVNHKGVEDANDDEGIRHVCFKCSSHFNSNKDLFNHVQDAHDMVPLFQCIQPDCQRVFNFAKQYQEHAKVHSQYAFICRLCNWHFKSVDQLNSHRTSYHRNYEGPRCHLCHKGFFTEKELQHHLETNTHEHKCEECNKIFRCRNELLDHREVHQGIRSYLCDQCGTTFNNRITMRAHRARHNSNKIHRCTECSAVFKKPDHLRRHFISKHKEERPFICRVPGCQKAFKRKDKLKEHQRCHSTETPYVCQYCARQYRHREGLRYHEKTHLRGQTLFCSVCNMGFSHKKLRNAHLKAAHGINVYSYSCTICSSQFPRLERLNRHMERCHSISVDWRERCQVCNMGFAGQKSLQSHMLYHHPEQGARMDLLPKRDQSKQDNTQEELLQTIDSLMAGGGITDNTAEASLAFIHSVLPSQVPPVNSTHKPVSINSVLPSETSSLNSPAKSTFMNSVLGSESSVLNSPSKCLPLLLQHLQNPQMPTVATSTFASFSNFNDFPGSQV